MVEYRQGGLPGAPQVTPLAKMRSSPLSITPEGENASCVGAEERGIVLRILPIRRIDAILKGEVTTLPQPPKDGACALAVLVVDFHYPVLVAHRNHDVAIVRRNRQLRCHESSRGTCRDVVWVQVIELFQAHTGCKFSSRSTITSPSTVVGGALVKAGVVVGKFHGRVGKHQPVTIWQRLHIVVEDLQRHIAFSAPATLGRRAFRSARLISRTVSPPDLPPEFR